MPLRFPYRATHSATYSALKLDEGKVCSVASQCIVCDYGTKNNSKIFARRGVPMTCCFNKMGCLHISTTKWRGWQGCIYHLAVSSTWQCVSVTPQKMPSLNICRSVSTKTWTCNLLNYIQF